MTNFHVSWKSAGKVNFLKAKVVKRRVWKTLNVISTLAIVVNTGMVGVLLQPKVASAASIGSYDQCANNLGTGYGGADSGCHWINGNLQSNNSRYSEGEATVQRVWLTGFAPGSSHTVTLQYGTTKGGKHAYDFLTTWNASESWIVESDQCQSITGCSTSDASENTFAIPHDPNGSGQFETGTRNFTMRGGTLTGATAPAIVSGSYAGDSETATTVSFTVAPSGAMCASGTCSVALWFGAHIAKSAEWQPFNGTTGAATISGSPYHVALAAMDGESIGQRDNQMQSATVVGQCLLTLVKTVDAVDTQTNTITYKLVLTNTGTADCTGGGVRIDDAIPTNTTYANWHDQSTNIDFGYDYTSFGPKNTTGYNGTLISWNGRVLAPQETGWMKFKVNVRTLNECEELDIKNSAKVYADQLQNANVAGFEYLPSNEVTTHFSAPCTATLKVNKQVDANGDGTFEGGNTEANTLGFDWGLDAGAVNRDMGTSATGLTVGSHDVTENSVANYHFVGWYTNGAVAANFSCTNPEGTILPITVNVAGGATKEITLCNARDTGRITFDKVVVGGDAADSDFTFTVDGNQYKDGDGASFPTGSYPLTEAPVPGYTLTDASGAGLATGTYTVVENSDGDYDLVGYDIDTDVNTPGAQITITKGQTTVLTVTNKQQKAKITISKDVRDFQGNNIADTTSFDVTSNAGNFNIAEGSPEEIWVNPGTYTFEEVTNGNYTIHSANPKEITVGSNGEASYTFVNWQKPSSITVCKYVDVNGDGNLDSDPLYTAEGGWTMWLDDEFDQQTVDGCTTFSNLTPGAYDISEGKKDGWTKTTPQANTVEVTVGVNDNGQTVNFGNFQLGKIWGYKYDTLENKLDGWKICLNSENCVWTGADEWPMGYYEFTGLTAGTYKVYEVTQYGWVQMDPNDPPYHTVVVTSGTGYGQYPSYNFWNRKNAFNVSIEKSADLEVVQAGANLTYTLNWSVTGNTPVEVKLFDALPANTTFVSADNGGFLDGTTVRWNLGTFNPAANGTVHLTVAVNSPLDKGTVISNTGNICGLGAIADGEPFLSDSEDTRRQKCDDDTTTTTVDSKPLLGIEKTANPTTVGGNQDVTYTITWSVAGNSKATNVVVNDPIPASTSYVSMGCGTTAGTCTMSQTGAPVSSVTWNLGTRNPGEGGTLTLVVKTAISVPNGSVIPNKADIRSAEVDPVFAQADVKAATAPQLQITKTTNATIVNPGDPISYTVKVKNIGTDTAINAVMTDTLPAGFSFVSTNPAAASIVGQTGTWNLGNMTVGQEVTITYTVNVAPGTTAGTYDNIAKAKADNASEVSTKVPVQTRVPQVLGETTNPVLQLRKSVSKATVAPGDVITYTVEIKNTGTGSAINVILTDLLPVGFTFDGTTDTTREWSLGDLAVGETKTVSYKVKVGSSVPNGSYENLAIASADNHGKVTTSVPVNVKRGRVLAEVVETGAGAVDLAVAGAGLSLIVLGFVLTRRKRGEQLA